MTQATLPNLTQTALTRALLGSRNPLESRYVSSEELAQWRLDPTRMTESEHLHLCLSGNLELDETTMARCPRCEAERREAKLVHQMEAAGISGRYLRLEWADLDRNAPEIARLERASAHICELVSSGQSVILWSQKTGTGKTQSAMLLVKAAIRAGLDAQAVNLGRLAIAVRDGYGVRDGQQMTEGKALELLVKPRLLLLDDLGAGETDNAAIEKRLLYQALDQRNMDEKPLIGTSNLTQSEMVGAFGARTIARLRPVEFIEFSHGVDFRAKKFIGEVKW